MNAKEVCKEVFQLVVRLIGLWFLYQSIQLIPEFTRLLIRLFSSAPMAKALWYSLVNLAWISALAYWFLIGAPQLMRIAFRDRSSPSEPTE